MNSEKKNHEKYLQCKCYPAKANNKDESILSTICINETEINDDVTPDNSEDYSWPKETICIADNSVILGLQPGLLSQKHKVKVKSFCGANVKRHARQYKTNFTTQTRIHHFTRWH